MCSAVMMKVNTPEREGNERGKRAGPHFPSWERGGGWSPFWFEGRKEVRGVEVVVGGPRVKFEVVPEACFEHQRTV